MTVSIGNGVSTGNIVTADASTDGDTVITATYVSNGATYTADITQSGCNFTKSLSLSD